MCKSRFILEFSLSALHVVPSCFPETKTPPPPRPSFHDASFLLSASRSLSAVAGVESGPGLGGRGEGEEDEEEEEEGDGWDGRSSRPLKCWIGGGDGRGVGGADVEEDEGALPPPPPRSTHSGSRQSEAMALVQVWMLSSCSCLTPPTCRPRSAAQEEEEEEEEGSPPTGSSDALFCRNSPEADAGAPCWPSGALPDVGMECTIWIPPMGIIGNGERTWSCEWVGR